MHRQRLAIDPLDGAATAAEWAAANGYDRDRRTYDGSATTTPRVYTEHRGAHAVVMATRVG